MDSTSLTSEQEVDSGVESTNSGDTMVYLRISVPELNSQKCLQFHQDDTVWLAKQQILSSLAKTLKDGFNYGLFCPPMHGRAGKFLDEERPLREYPLPGPIGYLEFKFKRRIYKQMQVNPKRMKQIHVKANLKQMIDAVKRGDINKVTKFTSSGLDPNFNDRDTGETPLTLASVMSHPVEMVMALVSGGAHLDFRTKKGLTPLHTAAQKGNEEALRVLLDLGSSTNYRDSHGLTPLYHAVCSNASARCVEILLYEHALLGVSDEYGWTEVHQASKAGNVQHLEQLIYYGADINLRNSGGNTPLHVCALNQQEECARVLLFRGANKDVLNYANQDAFDLAIISGNTQLALMIKDFTPEEVVPYKDFPTYSAKRRTCIPASTFSTLQRSRSNPQLHLRPFEVATLDESRELSVGGAFAGTSNERRPIRRRTELAFVSEFMTQAPFLANLPRSLSESSSGSGQVEDVDLRLQPKSPSTSLNENEQPSLPRTVALQEGENGFGFILRGAKAPDSGVIHLDFVPTPLLPALQYFEQVERNSPADGCGIQPGDFLLEVNGFDVRAASHDYTVRLIKESDMNLTLTIMTLQSTPNPTLSRVRAKSQTAAEILDALTVRRRNSLDSVRQSGFAELENFDRLLLDYERSDASDHTSIRGSCNESLSSAEGANDPSSKIASIRSVHGKRMAPAIPQPEHWPENGTTQINGLWKARSAHCLALSGIDEQFCAPKQVGASRLSLANHGNGSWLHSDEFCVRNEKRDYSSLAPRNRPPLPPGMAPKTPPVTTEACLVSSDVSGGASYHIMHSFSVPSEKTAKETTEKMGRVEIGDMEYDRKSQLNDQHPLATVLYNGISEDVGKFKVPPPPPPLKPPKSLAPQNSTAVGTSSVKVRPAVPRRKSHLQMTADTQEAVFTKPSEVSSDSVDFLTLAETARLQFLHRKSGDVSCMTVRADRSEEESTLRGNGFQPDVDNHNKGSAGFNKNPAKELSSEKPPSNQKSTTEQTSFQEELRNSLSKQCQFGASRRQVITGGGFANDLPLRPVAASSEPVCGQQKKHFEQKNDVTKNLSDSVSRDVATGSLVLPEHDGDASCRTGLADDLISLIIPPPPLFFSSNPVDEACSKSVNHSVVIGSSNLNLTSIDLTTLAPPPPPGFEDNTPAVIHTIKSGQQVTHAFRSRDLIQDLSRPVISWSVDDVRSWLESIQMTEHVESFERDRVDGLRLSRLGRNELIALGVTQVGQRMTIERAIKKAIMFNP